MKKEVKDTIISELSALINQYPHFYIVDVTGLNAEQTSNLRRKCFASEIKMSVVKNKLMIKAFDASEKDYTALYPSLKGNTAIMFTQTANVPAKMLKELKAEIPALKSKNELIADVIALLQSPAKNVISGLQGSAGNKIHGLLQAMAEKAE